MLRPYAKRRKEKDMTLKYRGEGKYVRRNGGVGDYGHCVLEVTALERGAGFVFQDRTVGGPVPREFIPAIKQGVQEAMARGVLAGYPVVDVGVSVTDGSFHAVDSNPFAFKMAGSMAFRDACRLAPMILLEPLFRAEVLTPAEYVGPVLGDLSRRRGILEQQSVLADGTHIVAARVPVAETFGYATQLRSLTQGRAGVSLTPCGCDEAPASVTQALVARAA